MCFYHIDKCPPYNYLRSYVFCNHDEANVQITRCVTWRGHSNPVPNGAKEVCPNMVIRHDKGLENGDWNTHGFGVERPTITRGCHVCWMVIYAAKWMRTMATDLSSPASSNKEASSDENLEFNPDHMARTEERDTDETASDQGLGDEPETDHNEEIFTTSDNEDEPRTPSNDEIARGSKYDASLIRDSDSTSDFSVEDEMTCSMYRYRGPTKIFAASPQDHRIEEVAVKSEPPKTRETHPNNVLRRRRQKNAATMATEMSRGEGNFQQSSARSRTRRRVSKWVTSQSSMKAASPFETTNNAKRPAVHTRSQFMSQPGACVGDAFEALTESVENSNALDKKDSAVNDDDNDDDDDDDDEQEIYPATQDGSYKDSVSNLFEDNDLETSPHRSSLNSKSDQAACEMAIKPNLRKRPRLVEDSTYVEADMLRESVKHLRCETAALSDRVVTLLQEQSATAIREVALLKRVAELEAKLDSA
ncbi:uncharacterized protein A1O9_00332 [Exophiala aquamarina CBS 119918]|uniref:Uncharacterized protein n=1 Tax=Exophiala aquamarina CBS 119918 TaxID=1182545 RepID=A0A072Q390_9EURO|nr:uncharacterized protein A1O9_00332 [Exophiala aquamarina CBS 119918]KEF62360.1 hypothetical protein A1O9_00332 [Exophiala aquamarina CBS 119918]